MTTFGVRRENTGKPGVRMPRSSAHFEVSSAPDGVGRFEGTVIGHVAHFGKGREKHWFIPRRKGSFLTRKEAAKALIP